MLSSKRSPRKSKFFRSRFFAAGQDAATIRDVHRLREYLAGQFVMLVLQACFLVALAFFARAALLLFERHGDALNPWALRLSLGGIVVCFLLVGRRVVLRVREIIAARSDLSLATQKLDDLREELRQGRPD